MSHTERMIVLIGLLLTAGFSGVYYAGRQTDTAIKIAQLPVLREVLAPTKLTEVPKELTDGWQTYKSERYGFAIDYGGEYQIHLGSDGHENVAFGIFPDHWRKDGSIDAEGTVSVMFYPDKKIPSYGMGEGVFYKDLDEFFNISVRQGYAAGTCVEENKSLAGYPARKIACHPLAGPRQYAKSAPRPYEGYFVERGNDLYAVVVSSAIVTSDGRDPGPIVERMLASFRFE